MSKINPALGTLGVAAVLAGVAAASRRAEGSQSKLFDRVVKGRRSRRPTDPKEISWGQAIDMIASGDAEIHAVPRGVKEVEDYFGDLALVAYIPGTDKGITIEGGSDSGVWHIGSLSEGVSKSQATAALRKLQRHPRVQAIYADWNDLPVDKDDKYALLDGARAAGFQNRHDHDDEWIWPSLEVRDQLREAN